MTKPQRKQRWGATVADMARELGIARSTVRKIADQLGIKRRNKRVSTRPAPFTAEQARAIMQRHFERLGKSIVG